VADGKRYKPKAGAGWIAEDIPPPPPEPEPPTPEEARRAEIVARLGAIDAASVRPSREIAAALADGKPAPAFAKNKLATLETEAAALRTELATL
jgi:hypothetical protein